MMNIAEIMECGVYSLGAFLTLEVYGADRNLEGETANPSLRFAAVQPVNQATGVVVRNNSDPMEQATHRWGYNFQLLNEIASREQVLSSFVDGSPWRVSPYAAPAGGSGDGPDPMERWLRELRERDTHPQPWRSNLFGIAHIINSVLELPTTSVGLPRIQQMAVDVRGPSEHSQWAQLESNNSTEEDSPTVEATTLSPGMSIEINLPSRSVHPRWHDLGNWMVFRNLFRTNLSDFSLHLTNIESLFRPTDEEESPEVTVGRTDLVALQVTAGSRRVSRDLTDFTLPYGLNFILATENEETEGTEANGVLAGSPSPSTDFETGSES